MPHPAVTEILKKQDYLDTRGKWITKIQEYDLEIQPTILIKGRGLAQLMVEGNEEALDLQEGPLPMVSAIIEELEQCEWSKDIVY